LSLCFLDGRNLNVGGSAGSSYSLRRVFGVRNGFFCLVTQHLPFSAQARLRDVLGYLLVAPNGACIVAALSEWSQFERGRDQQALNIRYARGYGVRKGL
jgi:hypothetical protein